MYKQLLNTKFGFEWSGAFSYPQKTIKENESITESIIIT